VLVAASAKKGIEVLTKKTPDLILCDIRMPGADGRQVLHYAKKCPENTAIPFLFFSAQTEMKDIADALHAGADGYVLKPFLIPELLDTLAYHLSKSEKHTSKTKHKSMEMATLF
jgi:CheY-like chemotaxis protein